MAVAVELPAGARTLLDRIDYSDAYSVRATTRRTAREAMQRALGSARVLLPPARFVHRGLRLRIVQPDADHPLGWSILSETTERLVLGTEGSLLTPRIQIHAADDCITLATVMRFERRSAAPVWAGVAPVHRFVLRRLIDASV